MFLHFKDHLQLLHLSDHLQMVIFSFMGASDFVRFGMGSRHCFHLMERSKTFWHSTCQREFVNFDLLVNFPGKCFYTALRTSGADHNWTNILSKTSAFSSVDREEESPSNVLTSSHCANQINEDQTQDANHHALLSQLSCGCYSGHPCYWSSHSSDDQNSTEWISFIASAEVCLVKKIMVLPYRAFWQPSAPAYAPLQVQIHFRRATSELPYYSSETFEVANEFQRQEFVFHKPVVFLGGEIIVLFIGKHQRQTLGPGFNNYYLCISEASVLGRTLPDFKLSAIPKNTTIEQENGVDNLVSYVETLLLDPKENSKQRPSLLGDLIQKSTYTVHDWLGDAKIVKMFQTSTFLELLETFYSDLDVESICMIDSAGNSIELSSTPVDIGLQNAGQVFLLPPTPEGV